MDPAETSELLQERGLIAIVRGAFTHERLLEVAEALVEGGVTALEVTLNTTDALAGIAHLKRHLGDRALIGAGTVRTKTDVDAAVDAGATFLIAPIFDPESIARAQRRGCLHLPGVFTPSEAQAALGAGCRLVKLFPADAAGPAYLKALRAPLDDIGFVPTGGINADNIGPYVEAGAAAFGIGSSLVAGPQQDLNVLAERAQHFGEALKVARAA